MHARQAAPGTVTSPDVVLIRAPLAWALCRFQVSPRSHMDSPGRYAQQMQMPHQGFSAWFNPDRSAAQQPPRQFALVKPSVSATDGRPPRTVTSSETRDALIAFALDSADLHHVDSCLPQCHECVSSQRRQQTYAQPNIANHSAHRCRGRVQQRLDSRQPNASNAPASIHGISKRAVIKQRSCHGADAFALPVSADEWRKLGAHTLSCLSDAPAD